jgi:hypothetical protein
MKRSLLPAWVLLSCLFSAAFGLQLGDMGRALTSPGQYERLPATFSYWDATPAARHLGLAFQGPDAVAQGRAYVYLTPVWLGLIYALTRRSDNPGWRKFYRLLDRHMRGWREVKSRLDGMAEELLRR